MSEKIKDYFSDNRRTAITVFAVIAVIVLIIGLCLSWFAEQNRLATVGKIKKPSLIKVLGPNATAMEEIDLTYNPDEAADENNKVQLTRTFCVVSGSDGFDLYLAHTTNISDLVIKLYRVNDVTGVSGQDGAEVSSFDGDGNRFYWNRKDGKNLYNTADGKFVNPTDESNTLGQDFNQKIFGGKSVQKNAIPLYWKMEVASTDKATSKYKNRDGSEACLTNFIIDLSWTDSNKETDVLYLIARSK